MADKSDAPVPWIGVYIAAASAVCSLLMLYDIIHGFVKRQRWLPCKLFKLNSVTLTLVAVVVKLTVDLTTDMPSDQDQLSKFAGTISLCIYMCYIFPSLGELKDSTNMFALSILVITVAVNICIQLSTEVIDSSFIPTHIIILCFMMFLLLVLWHFVLTDKNRYRSEIAECKSRFLSGRGSFLWRLKVCYLRSYMSNPQFVACMQMDYGTVGDASLILWLFFILVGRTISIYQRNSATPNVIRIESVDPSKSADPRKSAYRWSMEMIVWTQFFAVTVGAFASCFRRFAMSSHMRSNEILTRAIIEEPYMSNPIWRRKFYLVKAANIFYVMIIFVTYWTFSVPVRVFNWFKSKMRCASKRKFMDNRTIKAFEDLGYKDYDEWILQKSLTDMENLMKESKTKTRNLCNVLSRILTVSPRYPGPRPTELIVPHEDLRIPARLLPLTVLVKIIEASLPESTSHIITQTFKEAFETLSFIEKYVHTTRTKEREVAKAVWMASDFGHLLPKNLVRGYDKVPPPMDQGILVMKHIYEKLGNDDVGREVLRIKEFVMLRTYSSTEYLCYFMEDLFADLLDPMLAQLPEAILKAVTESPDAEFEERVQQSLKHLCKFESWDGIERWELPNGCEHLSGLIDPEVPSSQHTEDGHDQGDNVAQVPATIGQTNCLTSIEGHTVQDERKNQGIADIQVSKTSSLNDSPGERNDNLRPEEHPVTISDDDATSKMQRSKNRYAVGRRLKTF